VLTVIAITDEPLIEAGLRSILGQSTEFELTGVCSNTAQLAGAARGNNPDLIVCAVGPESEPAVADVRATSPRSIIIVLARDFTPEFAHHALELGVRGFISTTAGAPALTECLRTVARGELWMENLLSMRLLDTRPVRLSRRQTQLVRLLAQGLKNKEIAAALGIAEGTVKAYLTVLFEKVGAKDRFELALFGLKNFKGSIEDAPAPRMTVPMRSASLRPPIRRTVVA